MKSAPDEVIADDELVFGDSFRYCERVTRARARNFFYGIRLTPALKRGGMFAIYAWTRAADDLADGALGVGSVSSANRDGRRKRAGADRRGDLAEFRRLTLAAVEGHGGATIPEALKVSKLWPALMDTVRRFQIQKSDLLAMLDGQAADLDFSAPRDEGELFVYCDRVAGSVGRMCLAIWGYQEGSEALELAEYRGVAFQLTNILRDFVEDFEAGRVYFPQADFGRFGLTAGELREWAEPDRCHAFIRFQIARAEDFYERSAGLESLIAVDCVPTSMGMQLIYRQLLEAMSANPAAIVGSGRVRLTHLQKVRAALTALRQGRRMRNRAESEAPATDSCGC